MIATGDHRVVQVHPTLRCNLRCLHCYSASGPHEETILHATLLTHALTDARAEGYDVVGFSGGEPLMYPDLERALVHARDLGMTTTVTTNGLLLSRQRVEALRDRVDLLALSLDGIPDSHDRIRSRVGAFAAMEARLEFLRASGVPFGFIFTLTQHNVDELEWVATFARDQGARLLQVHPLETVGRAAQTMGSAAPDGIELAFAIAEARRLREQFAGELTLHVDVATIETFQHAVAEQQELLSAANGPLAGVISPLVIEASGNVVPLQHGFPQRFSLGNLHAERLSLMARRWCSDTAPAFLELLRRTSRSLSTSPRPGTGALNPYAAIARAAV